MRNTKLEAAREMVVKNNFIFNELYRVLIIISSKLTLRVNILFFIFNCVETEFLLLSGVEDR